MLGLGYYVSQNGSPAAGHGLACCLPCFLIDQFWGLGTEPRALHMPYLGPEMLKWAGFGVHSGNPSTKGAEAGKFKASLG